MTQLRPAQFVGLFLTIWLFTTNGEVSGEQKVGTKLNRPSLRCPACASGRGDPFATVRNSPQCFPFITAKDWEKMK
jgi:hypothetical protein